MRAIHVLTSYVYAKSGNLILTNQQRGLHQRSMAFRDANIVIIEIARTTVRAGLGLHDLLTKPTVVRAMRT
jgi:hypothetical protein